MIKNPSFVAKYAFYPLIHDVIKERRYKKVGLNKRAHSYVIGNGETRSNAKLRPLHYGSHIDSMIFGYYSEVLLELYEKELLREGSLSECIIAYRRIAIGDSSKNKSTINFAYEAFQEIKARSQMGDCVVLKYDLENYFNTINHALLKKEWHGLLNLPALPKDHYNVFRAATRFSYVLRDDLRVASVVRGRRHGFNEKRLARNLKKGIIAFFESPRHFREAIQGGELKIHRFPFVEKLKNSRPSFIPRGIPQGLPISAVLANLYLLPFDRTLYQLLVKEKGCYYRRYSDDIIIVCKPSEVDNVETLLDQAILERKVAISKSKTEKFLFKKGIDGIVTSIRLSEESSKAGVGFTYLGFEFYGNKTLIKSSNLAKFYRRMIDSVKRKVKRAEASAKLNNSKNLYVFKKKLYRLYTSFPLDKKELKTRVKWLAKNKFGDFFYKTKYKDAEYRSNYFTYVKRASSIMNEPAIYRQLRNHRRIFNATMAKHLRLARKRLE